MKNLNCHIQNISLPFFDRILFLRPDPVSKDGYFSAAFSFQPSTSQFWQIQFNSVWAFLPPANVVWGNVIFLHLSVILFTGGCLVPGGLLPGGGGTWSGVGVPGLGWGAWSRVVCSQGGVPGLGVAWGDPPGWLLLRAVRILLECILIDTNAPAPPSRQMRSLFTL